MMNEEDIKSKISEKRKILSKAKSVLSNLAADTAWETDEFELPMKGDVDFTAKQGIYVVELVSGTFDVRKKQKSGNYSRVNENQNNTLYVGSSKEIKTRLRQHLAVPSLKNRSTYSLWLSDWFVGKVKVSYTIFEESLDQSVLQIVEDTVWEIKQPRFGKKGGR